MADVATVGVAVADPTAAANGVSALPAPVDLPAHDAATSTPIHSVTGAILRRSMRLVDFFEESPDALDALVDFLQGVNAFMVHTKASGRELELDVRSKLVASGGEMKIVTYLRNRNDEEFFEDERGIGFVNDGPGAQIVTTLRRK